MHESYSKRIAIIGASGHGKVVADIARLNGYNEIVFLDDNLSISKCGDYPVIGKCSDALLMHCDVFVAIGNGTVREKILTEMLNHNVAIPTLVHPEAIIAEHVTLGAGTVVMPGAVINPYTDIGKGSIVNTCASVDHDCYIADYVHVAVGAHVCGTVTVGDRTWIGAGSTVINNVCICEDVTIGAGAVVINSINKRGTYVGVPAIQIKG